MAIFANPPALLDIPEDQMEAIRRRNRDTQNAVSTDALAPFAMMAVVALMEFRAGGLGAKPNSIANRELPIGRPRSKSSPRELAKPKSEAPCISSTLMPGWQMALSHPDVFFGIVQPVLAGCSPDLAKEFQEYSNTYSSGTRVSADQTVLQRGKNKGIFKKIQNGRYQATVDISKTPIKRGNYYEIDKFHKGSSAEIEVYNSQGKHQGTMDLDGKNWLSKPIKKRSIDVN